MILGHQKQIEYLKRILESGKIPHALLFTGERGLGKKRVAFEFLSLLLGSNPLSHPDFILIEPINSQIQIEQIRELNWKISLKPIKSKIKTAIIDSAHLMTKEAQNCFLKTLEEPKGNSLVILISEHQKLLLPTIISRCQTIKFFPVKRKEIENYLREKGLEKEKIDKILEWSLGKPEIAISLAENPKKLEELERIKNNLEKIGKTSVPIRFRYARKLLEKFKFHEILEIFLLAQRKNFLSSFDPKILRILSEIQKIYFFSSITYIDENLALENLFLKM